MSYHLRIYHLVRIYNHEDLQPCEDLPPCTHQCDDSNSGDVKYGPKTLDKYVDDMTKRIKERFYLITKVGKESHLYDEHVKQERVIVDVNTFLALFENGCQQQSCSGVSKITSSKLDAGVLCVYWKCTNGHQGRWTSSKLLC